MCVRGRVWAFTGESRAAHGGFILAEDLVLAGTAGDNGPAGEILHQSVTRFSGRMKPPLGGILSVSVCADGPHAQ